MKTYVCESCEQAKTMEGMKGSRKRGAAPLTCIACRELRPDESWCSPHRKWHSRSEFFLSSKTGLPRSVCKEAFTKSASGNQERECPVCHEQKAIPEFRRTGTKAGPGRKVCNSCDSALPGDAWCSFHECLHPRSAFFSDLSKPSGVEASCAESRGLGQWNRLSGKISKCDGCGKGKPSMEFRGGKNKTPVCTECEAIHAGERWCSTHGQWMPVSMFRQYANGHRINSSSRCKACHAASLHGVTIKHVMSLNGATKPECAACGGVENLHIDHNHSHCPGPKGCSECVRGYLCHRCNVAEGRLRTVENALALAAYMEKHQVRG